MQREFGQAGAALALVALLGGCGWVTPALTTEADTGLDAPFLAPRESLQPVALADSYTVRQIHGPRGVPVEETLQVEAGSVWPVEETPRATLANPDAALRGVPDWRPGEGRSGQDLPGERVPGGPLRGPDPRTSPDSGEPRPPGRRRGASSPPPPPLDQPEPDRVQVRPIPPGANAPPAPRSDGQVLVTPYGPVVTGPGTGRVQSFTAPGGVGGTLNNSGGFTTITPSGGVPQTFPTPR